MKLDFTLPSHVERDKNFPHLVDERRREKCGKGWKEKEMKIKMEKARKNNGNDDSWKL
jgi:hypothetical protein